MSKMTPENLSCSKVWSYLNATGKSHNTVRLINGKCQYNIT